MTNGLLVASGAGVRYFIIKIPTTKLGTHTPCFHEMSKNRLRNLPTDSKLYVQESKLFIKTKDTEWLSHP